MIARKESQTIVEVVEMKMFEKKMTQAKLAEELGVSKSKVSEILNGKCKPDLTFLKGLYSIFILGSFAIHRALPFLLIVPGVVPVYDHLRALND